MTSRPLYHSTARRVQTGACPPEGSSGVCSSDGDMPAESPGPKEAVGMLQEFCRVAASLGPSD